MRKKVLSVGTNHHDLLLMRNMVLAGAGYDVVAARNDSQAIAAITTGKIDAVIVGHSVAQALRDQIVKAAKLKRLPIVVLHTHPFEARVPDADANLCGLDGAARIVEVLTQLQ